MKACPASAPLLRSTARPPVGLLGQSLAVGADEPGVRWLDLRKRGLEPAQGMALAQRVTHAHWSVGHGADAHRRGGGVLDRPSVRTASPRVARLQIAGTGCDEGLETRRQQGLVKGQCRQRPGGPAGGRVQGVQAKVQQGRAFSGAGIGALGRRDYARSSAGSVARRCSSSARASPARPRRAGVPRGRCRPPRLRSRPWPSGCGGCAASGGAAGGSGRGRGSSRVRADARAGPRWLPARPPLVDPASEAFAGLHVQRYCGCDLVGGESSSGSYGCAREEHDGVIARHELVEEPVGQPAGRSMTARRHAASRLRSAAGTSRRGSTSAKRSMERESSASSSSPRCRDGCTRSPSPEWTPRGWRSLRPGQHGSLVAGEQQVNGAIGICGCARRGLRRGGGEPGKHELARLQQRPARLPARTDVVAPRSRWRLAPTPRPAAVLGRCGNAAQGQGVAGLSPLPVVRPSARRPREGCR